MKKPNFEISEVVSTHILYSGKRVREPTVIIRVGSLSLSRKAFILGAALACCQLLDGILTYIGLALLGIHMEANSFLRELMHAYGRAPVLFAAKFIAVTFVVILTFYAHRRRWFRWIIGLMICVYLALAVVPWTLIITNSIGNAPH
jgi:uncharacterized membrane protein